MVCVGKSKRAPVALASILMAVPRQVFHFRQVVRQRRDEKHETDMN
jgi:hypothetical protein